MIGYLLSDDLMFASRITATARSLGLIIKTARSSADVERLVEAEQPACVIIDLANPGLQVGDLLGKLHAMGPHPFIVAYGSHVDAATLKAARDAGCDLVLPRSKFVEELDKSLPQWFTS